MVGAHPFGGFNMSGTDSKAGGPDYLYLFTQAKSVARSCSSAVSYRPNATALGVLRGGLQLSTASPAADSKTRDAVVRSHGTQVTATSRSGDLVQNEQGTPSLVLP